MLNFALFCKYKVSNFVLVSNNEAGSAMSSVLRIYRVFKFVRPVNKLTAMLFRSTWMSRSVQRERSVGVVPNVDGAMAVILRAP